MNIHRLPHDLAVRHARGFTLIELMVAIVVSSIVVLGVFAFSTIQQTTANMHERDVRVQQSLEGAMWAVGRDIRSAGLGFTRFCTELRVWDNDQNRLINPGGAASAALAFRDNITDEAYWVLRDGLQVNWNSTGATTFDGAAGSSSMPGSAADSFDVIVAEGNYVQSFGTFTLDVSVDTSSDKVIVATHATALNNTVGDDLAAVQQLFPPGSFVAIVGPPTGSAFQAGAQSQCALLQITGDVQAGPSGSNDWEITVASSSQFNGNLVSLLDDDPAGTIPPDPDGIELDDWEPATLNVQGASVIPLGRLRWSRYEIDYTIPALPYLVRRDIIGFQDGVDPDTFGGGVNYPYCQGGQCPGAGLHLPGSADPPSAVAIGPLVEDMQVAVGCDGYAKASAQTATNPNLDSPIAVPEENPQDFGEKGPIAGPNAGIPNVKVDENPVGNGRDSDEWLGNVAGEQWGPDCVYYGTGQYFAAGWGAIEGNANPPPNFRMSPQTVRVSLVATAEERSAAGGTASTAIPPLEDRNAMTSIIPGPRERFTLTERFTPPNLRWRNPFIR